MPMQLCIQIATTCSRPPYENFTPYSLRTPDYLILYLKPTTGEEEGNLVYICGVASEIFSTFLYINIAP